MNTTTAANKALLQAIYAALADGDGRPLRDAMAEDFSWTIAGHSAWSRSWQGREAVLQQLLAPLMKRFATRYRSHADHFIAEDDTVVVQYRGEVMTTGGEAYDNHYCMVYRVADGRLLSVTEYMDTDLACRVLGEPAPAE
ncbi:nuclear transport factor 2 family protein [Roseateles sp. NT4]|uniref:nuclear transport factor 2 family protein n=1 Tax=Roseateles sp. NT4 TaxID=3453715 RepID=UPI003EF058E7